MQRILLGSDPELFLKNDQDRYVSAIDRFQGTKQHPVPLKELGKGFMIQVDNVAVEFNTPPAATAAKFSDIHNRVLDFIRARADKMGLKLALDASALFPEEELADPRALVFGCEPDYNAWALEMNPAPFSPIPNLRSAGGHIHVGITRQRDEAKVAMVRWMDHLIGAYSVLHDKDTLRKELYGRPGAMRFKPYGFEYRTVSNFWLKSTAFMQDVAKLTFQAVQFSQTSALQGSDIEDTQRMLLDNDQDLATKFLHPVRKTLLNKVA